MSSCVVSLMIFPLTIPPASDFSRILVVFKKFKVIDTLHVTVITVTETLHKHPALHAKCDDLCRILGPSFPFQRPTNSITQAAESPEGVLIAVGEEQVQVLEKFIADGEAEKVSICFNQMLRALGWINIMFLSCRRGG
jgi:hypothetical protein